MANPSIELIQHIRTAANKLSQSNNYEWGHMGSCNCGFLAQEITQLSRHEIHRYAMRNNQNGGDWSEQVEGFCATSGYPMDMVISDILSTGLTRQDLINLEWLNDDAVLEALPNGKRYLSRNIKADVVLYMHTWANVLEAQWLANQKGTPATAAAAAPVA